ncbi:hypothetical protein WJX74_008737 [Apatococcus lobatus]|uniref:Uncharacterized protein n=1 Tax=Apatococcus lobatus TaxID=904363 RepID=A0AAW1QAD0_9CHLO
MAVVKLPSSDTRMGARDNRSGYKFATGSVRLSDGDAATSRQNPGGGGPPEACALLLVLPGWLGTSAIYLHTAIAV